MSTLTNFDYQLHGMHVQPVTSCPLCNPPEDHNSLAYQSANHFAARAAIAESQVNELRQEVERLARLLDSAGHRLTDSLYQGEWFESAKARALLARLRSDGQR